MTALRVLVIDDDRAHADATAEIVRRLGHRVTVAYNGDDGLRRMRAGGLDLVVTDLVMRDKSGLDVVAAAATGPEVIVMTGYGSEEAAPAVRRAGAAAYLIKPLSVEMFRQVLERVGRLLKGRRAATRPDSDTCCMGMIGASPAMRRVFDLVRRVGDSHATVLVEGESGTGKELVARALHEHSPRAGGPFVPVNCAALSAGLLESELFGHEKGAFTGAYATRVGRFEAADGGTLLLDEVGEMDGALQAKLLRTLEEGEIVRVGSNEPIPVDVRVVAATNRPLKDRVDEGSFRADLFYRLHVVRIRVPALRERAGDIPLLVDAFLDELAEFHGRARPAVAPEAIRRLAAQEWRGNVRELRNAVETMMLTCGEIGIAPDDLPSGATTSGESLSMRTIADVEKELIANTLRDLDGNRERAAKALGISTRTLYRRIKELGLS